MAVLSEPELNRLFKFGLAVTNPQPSTGVRGFVESAAPCPPGLPPDRRTVRALSHSGFPSESSPMSDKSPRKVMSRKSGTSITARRAAKRSHESEESLSDQIHPASKR